MKRQRSDGSRGPNPLLQRENHYNWKGGRIIKNGYPQVAVPEHPRADRDGYVPEHVLICEKAAGRYLELPIEVHHFNEIRADNANRNLVVCENRAYHSLLHARQRIVERGGNPNTDKICGKCQKLRPRVDFWSSRSRADGLDNKCITCERKRSTLKNAKVRERRLAQGG